MPTPNIVVSPAPTEVLVGVANSSNHSVEDDDRSARNEVLLEYGRSAEVWVYQTREGHIKWVVEGGRLTTLQQKVQHQFQNVRIRVRQCLPEDKSALFKDRAAQALFHALQEATEAEALWHFGEVEREIQREAQRFARYRYLLYGSIVAGSIMAGGLVIALAVSAGWITAPDTVRTVVLAAVTGAAGAWASVLQRVWTLTLPADETPRELVLQGATRIIVGAIFSLAALAAIKAGWLFPNAATNQWSLGLVTFVAGFSERLVPDLVARLELQAAAGGSANTK